MTRTASKRAALEEHGAIPVIADALDAVKSPTPLRSEGAVSRPVAHGSAAFGPAG